MELKEIIEALAKSEVDDSVITAVKGLDKTEEVDKLTKDLEAERGKNAGILEDKKKFKERAETAEKSLKEIEDSKLTGEERTAKQVAELEEKLTAEKTAREEQAVEFAKQKRETALSDITGSIKWAKDVPHDTAKLIVEKAFADAEDLSDKTAVEAKIKSIVDGHKSFISAGAPAGTGGNQDGGTPPDGGSEEATMEDIVNESLGQN